MIRPISARDLHALLGDGAHDPELPGGRVRAYDVRAGDEFRAGHADGAAHLPPSHAIRWIPQQASTQELIVLIDADGSPHGAARHMAAELTHKWFRRLRYLEGGMAAWSAAGLPIAKDGAAGPQAASYDGTRPEFLGSGSVPWRVPDEQRAGNPLGPRRG